MTKTTLTSFELKHLKDLLDRYMESNKECYLNPIKQMLSDHWFMDAIGTERPKVFIEKFERADQDFIDRIKDKIDGIKYTEQQIACLQKIANELLNNCWYRKPLHKEYLRLKETEALNSATVTMHGVSL